MSEAARSFHSVSAECQGCSSAIRRAKRLGGWQECKLCRQEYIAEAPASGEAKRDPVSLKQATAITGSDLGLLARWSARIYGRGVSLEPSIGGSDHSKQEDERGNEFVRAMAVHRRFESLRSTPEGCLHASVLWYVYMERTGGTASGVGDLYGDIGIRFSTKSQREAWKGKRKSVASSAPKRRGKELHDSACLAYANLGR